MRALPTQGFLRSLVIMVSLVILVSLWSLLVLLFSLFSLAILSIIVSLAPLRVHVELPILRRPSTPAELSAYAILKALPTSKPVRDNPSYILGSMRSLDGMAIFPRRDTVRKSTRKDRLL